ncbi:MAG: ABC transporter permease [Candidatus Eisenbacteria bacterium]
MGIAQTIKDCYAHRVLIQSLVARQVRARYRGSALGFVWTFLNPLLLMLVYSLVFTVYMRFDMEDYGAFMFAGLLPWIWFSSSLAEATGSIVSSGNLITKALFPPEVLPITSVLANGINFLFSLPVLGVILLAYGVPPSVTLVALPLLVLVQLVFTLGFALMLSAANVQYRDVQHLLGNILVFWFFLCPVIYPVSKVPERFRIFALGNGMGALVTAYQDILFHGRFPEWNLLGLVAGSAIVVLLLGDAVFRRYRESFAEWL